MKLAVEDGFKNQVVLHNVENRALVLAEFSLAKLLCVSDRVKGTIEKLSCPGLGYRVPTFAAYPFQGCKRTLAALENCDRPGHRD